MHTAASVGVALWAFGALLLFVVPRGLWSDIPGGAFLVALARSGTVVASPTT